MYKVGIETEARRTVSELTAAKAVGRAQQGNKIKATESFARSAYHGYLSPNGWLGRMSLCRRVLYPYTQRGGFLPIAKRMVGEDESLSKSQRVSSPALRDLC